MADALRQVRAHEFEIGPAKGNTIIRAGGKRIGAIEGLDVAKDAPDAAQNGQRWIVRVQGQEDSCFFRGRHDSLNKVLIILPYPLRRYLSSLGQRRGHLFK